jgi:hypothetical protein
LLADAIEARPAPAPGGDAGRPASQLSAARSPSFSGAKIWPGAELIDTIGLLESWPPIAALTPRAAL